MMLIATDSPDVTTLSRASSNIGRLMPFCLLQQRFASVTDICPGIDCIRTPARVAFSMARRSLIQAR
jgi:hypothetical protein